MSLKEGCSSSFPQQYFGASAAQHFQPSQEGTDEDVLDDSLGKLAASANEDDLEQVRGLIHVNVFFHY